MPSAPVAAPLPAPAAPSPTRSLLDWWAPGRPMGKTRPATQRTKHYKATLDPTQLARVEADPRLRTLSRARRMRDHSVRDFRASLPEPEFWPPLVGSFHCAKLRYTNAEIGQSGVHRRLRQNRGNAPSRQRQAVPETHETDARAHDGGRKPSWDCG